MRGGGRSGERERERARERERKRERTRKRARERRSSRGSATARLSSEEANGSYGLGRARALASQSCHLAAGTLSFAFFTGTKVQVLTLQQSPRRAAEVAPAAGASLGTSPLSAGASLGSLPRSPRRAAGVAPAAGGSGGGGDESLLHAQPGVLSRVKGQSSASPSEVKGQSSAEEHGAPKRQRTHISQDGQHRARAGGKADKTQGGGAGAAPSSDRGEGVRVDAMGSLGASEELLVLSASARNRAFLCMIREGAGVGSVIEWLSAADDVAVEVVTCGWEEIDDAGSVDDRESQDLLYSLLWSPETEGLRAALLSRKQNLACTCFLKILSRVLGYSPDRAQEIEDS